MSTPIENKPKIDRSKYIIEKQNDTTIKNKNNENVLFTSSQLTAMGIKNASSDLKYIDVRDFFNTFDNTTIEIKIDGNTKRYQAPEYSLVSTKNMILSYFDTCFNKNCYVISGSNANFKLSIKRNVNDLRRFKMFANWLQNSYGLVFDNSISSFGSSEVKGSAASSNKFYFNGTELERYLIDDISDNVRRVGYDFVGWSFYYVPSYNTTVSQNIKDSVYSPSPVLRLCKELFIYYAQMNHAEGTSDLECPFAWK